MNVEGLRSGAAGSSTGGVTLGPVQHVKGPAGAVIGYNHDVPHEGYVYHVQTEDSGRDKGHIFTHVFRAGVIVASNRVSYDRASRATSVAELARAAHKHMLRRLVRGELDQEIARRWGSKAPVVAVTGESEPAANGPAVGANADPLRELRATHRARIQELIEVLDMDNISQILETLRNNVAGTLGVALVDYESGMCLGTSGTGLNMEVAAAGNMEVMKAKARVMRDLGIKGGIEDILITLDAQYHIIRPVGGNMFLYLAIDRKQGNLALARHKLASAAADVRT